MKNLSVLGCLSLPVLVPILFVVLVLIRLSEIASGYRYEEFLTGKTGAWTKV